MLETAIALVVAIHFVVTLIPPLGAFALVRWPRFLRLHLLILVWAFSIPFAHWPCPLTDLEKLLRARAGLPVYSGHFVQHYFWQPLGAHGEAIFNWTNTLCIIAGYGLFFASRNRPSRKRGT